MWCTEIRQYRAKNLQQIILSARESKFIEYEGQVVNSADIIGIFSASTMEEVTRRKNGEWKCKSETWHERKEKCDCPPLEVKILNEKISQAIRACGKCNGGYIDNPERSNSILPHDCIKKLLIEKDNVK